MDNSSLQLIPSKTPQEAAVGAEGPVKAKLSPIPKVLETFLFLSGKNIKYYFRWKPRWANWVKRKLPWLKQRWSFATPPGNLFSKLSLGSHPVLKGTTEHNRKPSFCGWSSNGKIHALDRTDRRRNRSHTEYLIRQREEFNNSFNSKRFASVCKSFFNGIFFNDKRFAKASSPQKNHNFPISPFEKNQLKLGKCESKPQDTTPRPLEQLLFKT